MHQRESSSKIGLCQLPSNKVFPPLILIEHFLGVIATESILDVVPSGKYKLTVTSDKVCPQL